MDTQMRVRRAGDGGLTRDDTQWVAERGFRQGDVPAVRRFAREFGARTGIASARLADFVLAVSEAAACAEAVGPCTARVRLWIGGSRAFCEVRGNGMPVSRAVRDSRPAARPSEVEELRHWVLRRLSDHVCLTSGQDGMRVLLSVHVA